MSHENNQTEVDNFPPDHPYANTNTVCLQEWRDNEQEMQEPIFLKWRFVAFDGQVCVVDLCQWNVGAEVEVQSNLTAANEPSFLGIQ